MGTNTHLRLSRSVDTTRPRNELRNVGVLFVVVSALLGSCSSSSEIGPSGSMPQSVLDARAAATEREDTLVESIERIRACMEESGFHVEIEIDEEFGGMGITGNPGSDQAAAYHQALGECEARVFPSLSVGNGEAPSEAYLSALFDYYTALSECLEQLGYDIPESPSRDTFIEMSPPWSPYDGLEPGREVPESEWRSLNAACPQSPAFLPSDF